MRAEHILLHRITFREDVIVFLGMVVNTETHSLHSLPQAGDFAHYVGKRQFELRSKIQAMELSKSLQAAKIQTHILSLITFCPNPQNNWSHIEKGNCVASKYLFA